MILASASPRRRQLLKKAKIRFKVMPSRIFEPPPGKERPVSHAKRLALAKARSVAAKVSCGFILGADTVVVLRGRIYGKPSGPAQARRILKALQGTTHRVVTGVALIDAETGRARVGHSISHVTMRRLNPGEIRQYSLRHPDKAGAYAVQEKKDPVVVRIRGSYTNVVGLPMELVRKLLKAASCC